MAVVMPISQLISASVLCAIAWVSWKCFQRFVLGSPLDNIPGPPSDSFMTGESATWLTLLDNPLTVCHLISGMSKRFFLSNANDYHKELLERCTCFFSFICPVLKYLLFLCGQKDGTIVKLTNYFGVCFQSSVHSLFSQLIPVIRKRPFMSVIQKHYTI